LENELDTLLSERKMVLEDELEQAKQSGMLFDRTQPMYMDGRIEEVMSDISHFKIIIQALQATDAEIQKVHETMPETFGKLDYSDARKVSTSLIKSLDGEEAVALLESLTEDMLELRGYRTTNTVLFNCSQSEYQQVKLALDIIYQKISQSVSLAHDATAHKADILPEILLLYQQVSQTYATARNVNMAYRDTDLDELSPTPTTISRSFSMLAIPISDSKPSLSQPIANSKNSGS
jgi:hypothetical protein